MSDTPKPIAKSDLPTRFVAAVVMVAVALAATWAGGWPFRLLGAAAAALMIVEWGDIHRVARLWSWLAALLLAAALLGGLEYLYPVGTSDWTYDPATGEMVAFVDSDSLDPNWLGFGGISALALLVALVSRRAAMGGGILYVGLPTFAMLSLSWAWEILVFWVFIVTWATDILAYFAGRTIGGPKLAPKISPNKTWAGLIGGVAGAALFGWLAATWFEMGSPFIWLGGAMGLIAQAGDLYESRLKRRAGVKDSGTLLPGHGGVLDRLDGLLPVALATALLVMAGLWTA